MTITVYMPLVITGVFGLIAPTLARRLPPRLATWLLSAGALFAAMATMATLGLLALPQCVQVPAVARWGGWSDRSLAHLDPVRAPVAVAAAVALTGLLAHAVAVGAARSRALRSAHRLAATISPGGELVVVPSASREAFCLPGRPGRIVVTSAMLRALDARQRRALLAHERTHLYARHHCHHIAVRVSAALNPLLRPVVGAVALSCERWADETAAEASDRQAVATALVRAALGQHGQLPGIALAATDANVAYRVQAMREPRPTFRWWRLTVPLLLFVTTTLALGNAVTELYTFLMLARR